MGRGPAGIVRRRRRPSAWSSLAVGKNGVQVYITSHATDTVPQHVAAYSQYELDEYKQRIISDTEYECLEEPIVIKKAINGMPVVLTMRSSNGHGQPVDEKRIWTVEFVRNSRYYNLTMECALADREAWFPIFDRIAHSLRTMPELEVPRATPVEVRKATKLRQ